MVTNLKLTGQFNIGLNSTSQMNVGGTFVNIKEIPFVRYEFDSYDESAVKYIMDMMFKFNLSTHLIQFKANDSLIESLKATSCFQKVAKYLYFNITEQLMQAGTPDAHEIELAIQAKQEGFSFDRYMIIDNTVSMQMVSANEIIDNIAKALGIDKKNIGICNSPLCMTGEFACLTAVKARELASLYNSSDEVALPSANHQCMNTCGCMRYFEVTSDIAAPAEMSTKSVGKKVNKSKSTDESAVDGETPKKESMHKKAKPVKVLSISQFV